MRAVRPFAVALLGLACATPDAPSSSGPARYRLTESGEHWNVVGDDAVFEDLRPRYPEFFEHVLDPGKRGDLDLRPLRGDLEREPVDRRNFDALNAVAIAYFELNYRAQELRGGSGYFDASFQAAKLLGLPWKAYGLVQSGPLRDAILDFFEDAASGHKLGSRATTPRLAAIVASLAPKEADAGRRRRIREIAAAIDTGGEAPAP